MNYLIKDTTLQGIADAIRTKIDDQKQIAGADLESRVRDIDRLRPMNAIPENAENGYYGNRVAAIAQTYADSRYIDGAVWNYNQTGIFDYYESGGDDAVNDNNTGDSGTEPEDEEVVPGSGGSVPMVDEGYRLFGYATQPTEKEKIPGNLLDCSTLLSLILRGIPYQQSPWVVYAQQGTWNPADIVNMYGDQGWEQKVIDQQPEGRYQDIGIPGYSSLRTAADLAEFYFKTGKIVFDKTVDGNASTDLTVRMLPGDLIFWNNGTQPTRFRGVSHCAVSAINTAYCYECTHGNTPTGLPYGIYYRQLTATKIANVTLIIRPDYRPRVEPEQLPLGVNLCVFPWTFSRITGYTFKGITMDFVDSNTIHLSGTNTGAFEVHLKGQTDSDTNFLALEPGTYQVSGMDNTGVNSVGVALQIKQVDGTEIADDSGNASVRCYAARRNPTFTVTKETKIMILLHFGELAYTVDCDISPSLVRIA